MVFNKELLAEKENYLSFIVDNFDGPCYIADINTHELLFINKRIEELLGCNSSDIQGLKCYKVLQNKDNPCNFCNNAYLKENEYYCWEHYNDYIKRYYSIKDTLIIHEGKKLRLEIATDITAQKEKYNELENQSATEQLLVKCASTLCLEDNIDLAINEILSIVGNFYKAIRAYLFEIDDLNQYTNNTHEWCGPTVESQIHSLQKVPISILPELMEKLSTIGAYSIDSISTEIDINSGDYKILEILGIKSILVVPLLENNRIVGFIGVDEPTIERSNLQLLKTVAMFIHNNLNKIKTARKLAFLSTRDSLTGLYNRNYYDITLKNLKQSSVETLGVVYMDINGLKAINDKYGLTFGNGYIITCADIIKEHFKTDFFRIGGDEFLIFLADITYKEFDEKITSLQQKLSKIKQVSISLGASWCGDLEDIEKHINLADLAMLKDKEINYKNINDSVHFLHQSFEELLTQEIESGVFEILLQPKISLDTKKTVGAEALIRKKDDDGKYIPPYQFIPKYETQGIIFLIDLFVFRQVCQLLSKAKTDGVVDLPQISLNFSRITVLLPNIHLKCLDICKEYSIDPAMITIEVTEDCGFVESAAIGHVIEKLRKMGFKISLDDFGCKYSNIEILSSISFDEVKLDKSLLYNNGTNASKQIILEHLIDMFQEFPDISIVVEGIEEQDHLDLIKSGKGLIGQGYLFSKPISKQTFWEFYNKG